MPIFLKQNGEWKTVDSPYIRRNGQWILPEEAYIKDDGQWKLIFEEFAFTVETVGPVDENVDETVLKGQLAQFEDFLEGNFFDQTLTNSSTGDAVATNGDLQLTAIGGGDDTVYIYDNDFAFIDTLTDPTDVVNAVDIATGVGAADPKIAVGCEDGNVYIYDATDFTLLNTLSNPNGPVEDVQFRGDSGSLAAGSEDTNIYIYAGITLFPFATLNDPSSPVRSVSSRETDDWIAASVDNSDVFVYNDSLQFQQQLAQNPGVSIDGTSKVEFSPQGKLAIVDESVVKVLTNNFAVTAVLNDSTEGTEGDVAWGTNERLAHASTDNRVYLYNNAFNNIATFDDASRQFVSLDWGTKNQYLVGGTAESGSGEAHVFSTGVRMFFDWGQQGLGLPNRQRSTGLQSLSQFELGLDDLNNNTTYEYRAGGIAAEGRTVTDTNILQFTTVDLDVETETATSITSTSATLEGEVLNFNRSTPKQPKVGFDWGEQGQGFPNSENVGLISPGAFSANISGLDTDTIYEYRATAEFGGVEVTGQDESFQTLNVTAALDVGQADPVDFGTAFVQNSSTGTTEVTETITLQETSGTGDYDIEASSDITGTDASQWSIDTSLPITVPAGGTDSIDVTFDPTSDGTKNADLNVQHTAASQPDPIVVALDAVAENVTELQVQGSPSITATNDGNVDSTTVTIEEVGTYYDATITDISESASQPTTEAPDTSEWSISNTPTTPANVPAGGTETFDVGWNPDSSGDQNYNVTVTYDGTGINTTELIVTVEGTVSGSVTASVDADNDNTADTSFDFGGVFTNNVSAPNTFTALADPFGAYDIIELDITGTNASDFSIQNAPSNTTDNDTNTSTQVGGGNGDLNFDIQFDPGAEGVRNAALEVTHDATNPSPLSISLEGEGLQPSEVQVSSGPGNFGTAIFGGNVSGEEATKSFTISNASDDQAFDITSESIDSDFVIQNSIDGETGILDGSKTVTADLEFEPAFGQRQDDEFVSQNYTIGHTAQSPGSPLDISIEGTLQVTELEFDVDGNIFTPSNDGSTDFNVFANPDDSESRSLNVTVPTSGNTVSTGIQIADQNATSVTSGSIQSIVSPGNSTSVSVTYAPSSLSDDNDTADVQVEWDNLNLSENIDVTGLIESTVDVQTVDAGGGGGGNDTLDFGTVTENESQQLSIEVSEVLGNQDFDITANGSLVSGDTGKFTIDSNFGSTPVLVSNGSPVSSNISFNPQSGDAGTTQSATLEFEHNAAYAPAAYESSPVSITLQGDVAAETQVAVRDPDDSPSDPLQDQNTIEYESIEGNTVTDLIDLREIGGNNDATVESLSVSDSGSTPFVFNNSSSFINTSNPDNLDGGSFTISAGTTVQDQFINFTSPSDGTDGDTVYTETLTVEYSGQGISGTTTATGTLEGTALEPATAEVSTNSITFQSFDEDTDSTPYTDSENFTVSEVYGNETYDITGVSSTGDDSFDFNVTGISSGDTIGGGTTAIATANLDTSTPGIKDATIEISHDAAQGPDPLTVDLNASIEGDMSTATLDNCTYTFSGTGGTVSVDLGSVPENSEPIIVTLAAGGPSTVDNVDPGDVFGLNNVTTTEVSTDSTWEITGSLPATSSGQVGFSITFTGDTSGTFNLSVVDEESNNIGSCSS